MNYNLTCAQILAEAGISWDVEWSLEYESYFPLINGYPVFCADVYDRWDTDSGIMIYEHLVAPSLLCINGVADYFSEFYNSDSAIPHIDPGTFSESGPDTSVFLRFNADGTFEAGFKYLVLKGDPSLTFGEFVSMAVDIARTASHSSDWDPPIVPGLSFSIWDERFCDEVISKGGTFEDYCLAVVWEIESLDDIISESEQDANKVVAGIKRLFESTHPGIEVKIQDYVAPSETDPKYVHEGSCGKVYSLKQMNTPDIAADSVRQVARILNSAPTYDELVAYYYGEDKNPRWYGEDTLRILFG